MSHSSRIIVPYNAIVSTQQSLEFVALVMPNWSDYTLRTRLRTIEQNESTKILVQYRSPGFPVNHRREIVKLEVIQHSSLFFQLLHRHVRDF
jgi:hypothetical protein